MGLGGAVVVGLLVGCLTTAIVCACIFQARLDEMERREREDEAPRKLNDQESWNAALDDIDGRERGGR